MVTGEVGLGDGAGLEDAVEVDGDRVEGKDATLGPCCCD